MRFEDSTAHLRRAQRLGGVEVVVGSESARGMLVQLRRAGVYEARPGRSRRARSRRGPVEVSPLQLAGPAERSKIEVTLIPARRVAPSGLGNGERAKGM